MRCAIISPGFLPVPATLGGAVEVLIEEIVKGNEENKVFDIDLFTVEDNSLNSIEFNNCKIIQIKTNIFHKIINKGYNLVIHKILRRNEDRICPFGIAVNNIIKKNKYDYIIVENNMEVYNSIVSSANNKSKLIFHLHNNLDEGRPRFLCEKVIETSQCTLSASEYLCNQFNNIKESNKNLVLYNCVDFDIFNPDRVQNEVIEQLKNNYKLKDDEFCYIYTGRIAPEKGIVELIDAFKKIAQENNKVKLIIVGQGWFGTKEKSELEKQLLKETKSINDKIIFTGFINHDEIPKVLSIADCVVIPSKWDEPFGVVALEAMSMKKGIIATKSGGLVEPLNEECAILIENNRELSNNLYHAMAKVLYDKKICKQMGENGYRIVHERKEFNSKNYFLNLCDKIGVKSY